MENIKFKLTENDYIQLNRFLIISDKKMQRRRLIARLFALLVYCIIFIALLGVATDWIIIIIAITLVVPFWFITKKLLELIGNASIIRMYKMNPAFGAESDIVIVDDIFIKITNGKEIKVPISEIMRVDNDIERIYITCSDGIRIVPISAFKSKGEIDEFLNKIKGK